MRDAHNPICRLLQCQPAYKMRHDDPPENKRLKIHRSYWPFCKYWLNLNSSTLNLPHFRFAALQKRIIAFAESDSCLYQNG